MAAKNQPNMCCIIFYRSSDTEGKLKINLLYKASYSHMKAIYDTNQVIWDI